MTMRAPLVDSQDDHPYADVHLMIYHNDTQVLCCKPLYIGFLGMTIASGPLTYPKHTPLELRVSLPSAEGYKEFQLAAAVTASSEGGLGLTYDHRFGNQVRRLLEMLTDLYHMRWRHDELHRAEQNRSYGRMPSRPGDRTQV